MFSRGGRTPSGTGCAPTATIISTICGRWPTIICIPICITRRSCAPFSGTGETGIRSGCASKPSRNRHCESYWIRLHGIEKGRRCARSAAEIPDAGSIRLTVYGATGITVTLPPQIDRENFAVFLNRQRFSFSSYTGGPLVFVRNGGWIRADAPAAADLRKGTGLLDVYLDSLRIVIPDGVDEELRELAGGSPIPAPTASTPGYMWIIRFIRRARSPAICLPTI